MFLSTLEPRANKLLGRRASEESSPPLTQLLWFCDGLLLFFLIPWFGTSVLTLDNDFYYAVFIWSALTFLVLYVRTTNSDIVGLVRIGWRSSVFVGVLASVYLVVNVWNANATEHPDGLLLLFEILWRGVAYGIVSALVVTAFPLAVAIGLLGGVPSGVTRRAAVGLLTLVLVWTMSTTHHLGFAQFDRDDIVTPQLATTAISVPAILTLNPIGSVLAQTSFHVAVTLRVFESNVLVPPEVEFVPDYEPPGIFGPR